MTKLNLEVEEDSGLVDKPLCSQYRFIKLWSSSSSCVVQFNNLAISVSILV